MSTRDERDKEAEGRLPTLPKWAQSYITGMHHRIRDLEGLQQLQKPTAVLFGWTMKGSEHGYIPDNTTVSFDLGKNGVINCYRRKVPKKVGEEFMLEVSSTGHELLVLPYACNMVRIVEGE